MKMITKLKSNHRTDLKIILSNAEQKESDNKLLTRESLRAEWDNQQSKKEEIVAIGINPSTAHNGKSDNTITKLCRFLDMYGFDNLSMLNLYENVSSIQIKDGKIITDFDTKRAIFENADIILIVWGYDNKKDLRELKANALKVLSDYSDKLYCIRNSNNKSPAHPSRMRYEWDIVPFDVKKQKGFEV